MFSPTSPNVSQTLLRHPLARRGRRTTRSIKIIGAAAFALLAAANSVAHAADDSTRMAREHHACTVTALMRSIARISRRRGLRK